MEYGRRSWRNKLLVGWCVGMLPVCLIVSGCDKSPDGEKPAGEQASGNQTTRMTFQELFDVNGNMVTPKVIIKVGSTTMTPEVPFESQVMRIDNAPFSDFIGHDAEVRKEGDFYRIIQFY
jgi:hypothetical protein